jgi:hypothetical protein
MKIEKSKLKELLFLELELLKALDIVCLDTSDFLLFNERKMDKETMLWAVKHLSECPECCLVTSELTEIEIREALKKSDYEKLTVQTVKYYFLTLNEAKRGTMRPGD